MINVRTVLVSLGVAFTAYLAARGLAWTGAVAYPIVIVIALSMYLITTWLCIFWDPREAPPADDEHPPPPVGVRGPTTLPLWACVLAIACAVLVPSSIALGVGADSRTEPFATWYLGGIGVLMTIVMVRRRPLVAWAGIVVLAAASMAWMGVVPALQLGLVGSIVWVVVAQLLLFSIDRAARDTAQLAQLQRAASAWQASQAGRQRERRVQVQRALAVAGPVLSRTVATGGRLDDEQRLEARVAEGALRDEMRGPRLLDDEVRSQLEAARRRGATVTVLDEGGLDGADAASLALIRAQLAETVSTSQSDRLYIRTSPDEHVAVTVVGRSAAASGHADEDVVELWHEIAHPD